MILYVLTNSSLAESGTSIVRITYRHNKNMETMKHDTAEQ